MDEQLIRVVVPTSLLVEIDERLATEGSSRSRTDFVREAIEQRLLELRFGSEEPTPFSEVRSELPPPDVEEELDIAEDPLTSPRSLVDTRLVTVLGGSTVVPEREAAAFSVEAGPLFLHGRDYPSLWCLYWLARLTEETPLELNEYLRRATELAWVFAGRLAEFDFPGQLKVTTMFPTSKRNPASAEQTFQAAAIGGLLRRRDGSRVAIGPLPFWNTATVYERESKILIAPTQHGLDLLEALEGLSLQLPHGHLHAQAFLRYLQEQAPTDHTDFIAVLRIVGVEPTRAELIEEVRATEVGDTDKLADVYAQAYVSRGREWGFIEPKMTAGSYRLTDMGREVVDTG